jgi:hypothetical protein
MTRSLPVPVVLCALMAAACSGGDSKPESNAGSGAAGSHASAGKSGGSAGKSGGVKVPENLPSAAHTIAGVISDVASGARIANAEVSVVGSDKKVTSNASGEFAFDDLPEGMVSLSISKDGYAPGFAVTESSADAQASLVSLKKLGSANSYDASKAATLVEKTDNGPYAVIFMPDSLDTSDTNLKVSVTPLDPTTEEAALPGDLVAGGSSPTALQAVTFAEFSIIDSSGKRVNLKAGSSAIVELPIPLALRGDYPLDSKIHCYAYDPTTGKWEDFVEGTVMLSSVDMVTPVLRASIRHFSWYGGAPEIQEQECVVVQVISKVTGKPLAGATISARPGLKAVSDDNGVALITVEKGAKVQYTATKTYTDTYVDDAGNLISQKGSKVIEFGRVVQDDELVALTPGPCKDAAKASASDKALKIDTAPLPNGAYVYEVTGSIASGTATISISKGIPDEDGELSDTEPVDGANVTLRSEDGTQVSLDSLSAMLPPGVMIAATGYYTSPSGMMLSAKGGERYTLDVDADGNGSIDASATCIVPGMLSWVVPQAGQTYDSAGFTASWSDSASDRPGYSTQYVALIVSTNNDSLGGVYSGSERSFTPDPALMPGSYQAELQTSFASAMFSGISVQGTLLCGVMSGPQVTFTIK